jgi:hypothetical protein
MWALPLQYRQLLAQAGDLGDELQTRHEQHPRSGEEPAHRILPRCLCSVYIISAPPDPTGGGAGATAVPRISIVPFEATLGIGFLVNINQTTTPGQGLLDFMDMNGDRFPGAGARKKRD